MIENEYSRQEDSYKQQIADLEEEKEQLQVSICGCFSTGKLPDKHLVNEYSEQTQHSTKA